jgi:predicted small metal-binding protein
MRVIECDRCGDTLSAADDAELGKRLARHVKEDHEEELSDEDVEELLGEEAYDAMDA